MSEQQVGKVVSIALRTAVNGPMREVTRTTAHANAGLEGDLPVEPHRGITLLAKPQWEQVTRELGADLPWHTRRANILVDCPSLADLIGKTIHVGPVEVEINGETDPCRMMDKQHQGLRDALVPDVRGGVYGRIASAGTIQVGDMVTITGGDDRRL